MFARLVEATAQPGKRDEINTIATNDLLPVLKKQPGFLDSIGLSSDTTLNEGAGLSLWNSKNDAEVFYKSAEYTKILDRIKPLVADMKVRTFTVENSTFHKIAAGKGA